MGIGSEPVPPRAFKHRMARQPLVFHIPGGQRSYEFQVCGFPSGRDLFNAFQDAPFKFDFYRAMESFLARHLASRKEAETRTFRMEPPDAVNGL